MQTIYGICYDLAGKVTTKYQFYAEVKTLSQNVQANKSQVSIALKARRNPDQAYAASAYNMTDAVTVVLKVDGKEIFRNTKLDIDTRNGRVWTFTTQTVEVNHNADGSKTMGLDADFSGGGVSSLDSGEIGAEVELTAIPRNASILTVGDVTLGESCYVKFQPESADFTYRLEFSLGQWTGKTGLIAPGRTSAYLYTGYVIPMEVAEQIKGGNTAQMTVSLYSYSDQAGTAQIGVETASFRVLVPATNQTMPAVHMQLEPVNSMEGFDGVFVQGKSKLKATITAEGKYGAQILSYQLKVEGKTYEGGTELVSDFLSTGGNVIVTGIAIDERGIQGAFRAVISVAAYSKPKVLPYPGEADVVAARCDAEGSLADGGTYLIIRARRQYSTIVSGGERKNLCQLQYRYQSGGSYSQWQTILARDSESDQVDTGALLGTLDSKVSYTVQIRALDDVGEYALTTIAVPTEAVHTHRTKNGMGLGKYVEGENLLDVGWDAHFHGAVKIGDMTLKDYILQIISEGA